MAVFGLQNALVGAIMKLECSQLGKIILWVCQKHIATLEGSSQQSAVQSITLMRIYLYSDDDDDDDDDDDERAPERW